MAVSVTEGATNNVAIEMSIENNENRTLCFTTDLLLMCQFQFGIFDGMQLCIRPAIDVVYIFLHNFYNFNGN